MYRVDTANNVASLPTKLAPETTAGYFANNPGAGPGTKVPGDWLNTVQEEIAGVILGASIALDRTNNAQLLAAIQALIAAATTTPTGVRVGFVGTVAPSTWVLANGKTIGDGSSGATGRANADTQALFTLLWNSFANTELAVSGGRGANAAADFGAHKTIALPDYSDRVALGKGDMSGADAGLVTVAGGNFDGTIMGKKGGTQNHVIAGGEIPLALSGINAGSTGGPVSGSVGQAPSAMPLMNPAIVESVIIKL